MASPPVEILQTSNYSRWFASLRDVRTRARIDVRIRRLSLGNPGDARSLGGRISELRVDFGPGYRVYFARKGPALILLLAGGDKSRQQADIARAREIAAQWDAD